LENYLKELEVGDITFKKQLEIAIKVANAVNYIH
jgi:hypothetical protein